MNKIDHHSDRIIEFIFILLNQFIYDTDHKSQYLEFFNSLKIQWEIYPLINEDNIGDIGEFYMNYYPQAHQAYQAYQAPIY